MKGIFVAVCRRFRSGSTPILTDSSIRAWLLPVGYIGSSADKWPLSGRSSVPCVSFPFQAGLYICRTIRCKALPHRSQNIRLFPADLLVQFAQEIREAAEFFIISFIDHISMLLCLCKFEFIMIFSEIPMFQGIFRVKCPNLMCFSLFCPYGQKQEKIVSDKKQSACWILIDRDSFSRL